VFSNHMDQERLLLRSIGRTSLPELCHLRPEQWPVSSNVSRDTTQGIDGIWCGLRFAKETKNVPIPWS
jgi:hypothetical protein